MASAQAIDTVAAELKALETLDEFKKAISKFGKVETVFGDPEGLVLVCELFNEVDLYEDHLRFLLDRFCSVMRGEEVRASNMKRYSMTAEQYELDCEVDEEVYGVSNKIGKQLYDVLDVKCKNAKVIYECCEDIIFGVQKLMDDTLFKSFWKPQNRIYVNTFILVWPQDVVTSDFKIVANQVLDESDNCVETTKFSFDMLWWENDLVHPDLQLILDSFNKSMFGIKAMFYSRRTWVKIALLLWDIFYSPCKEQTKYNQRVFMYSSIVTEFNGKTTFLEDMLGVHGEKEQGWYLLGVKPGYVLNGVTSPQVTQYDVCIDEQDTMESFYITEGWDEWGFENLERVYSMMSPLTDLDGNRIVVHSIPSY